MSARKPKPERPLDPGAVVPALSYEEIARRAYEIHLSRGAEPGHDLENWLQAERELIEEAGRSDATGGRSV